MLAKVHTPPSTRTLRCPVCRRDVAGAPWDSADEALRARTLFVAHAQRQHGVGEVEGLLIFAEAMRRRPGR